jgi:hypothetical protein
VVENEHEELAICGKPANIEEKLMMVDGRLEALAACAKQKLRSFTRIVDMIEAFAAPASRRRRVGSCSPGLCPRDRRRWPPLEHRSPGAGTAAPANRDSRRGALRPTRSSG